MIKILKRLTAAVAMLCIAICGCGCHKEASSVDNSKVIYASFYAVYDFVRTISNGSGYTVKCLVPAGVEPHEWEPSTKTMRDVSDCAAYIFAGAGMDDWSNDIVALLPEGKALNLAKIANIRTNGKDPHVWLNFDYAIAECSAISAYLCKLDPDNDSLYKNNLSDFISQVMELNDTYATALSCASCNTVVTTHGAFSYLCDKYNLTQVVVDSAAGESDPSLKKLSEVVDLIKNENIPAIFYIEGESDKVANTVAKDVGSSVKVFALNPFEFDDEDRGYVQVMTSNLDTLRKALCNADN